MNLSELAEESARRLAHLGERTALDFEGKQYTTLHFRDWTQRLLRGFSRLGLAPGQIAVLCMINDPLVYPVFGAIFGTGGTAVPVMFMLAVNELRYVIADSKARGVVTDQANAEKVREAVRGLDHVEWIVVRGGKDDPAASPSEHRLETLLESEPLEQIPAVGEDDVALMLYTSGTTGKPKGVMLTHGNLIASARGSSEASELDRWEGPLISISAMPMAHIFGVGVMNGGYLVPERIAQNAYGIQLAWFDPERFMQLIEKHRCTSMPSVPTMLSLILNHPKLDHYDLSSLRDVVCGAAPLPVELAKAFQERFGCRVREIYGLTESAGLGSANRPSDPYRPGSAGRPYFNTELRIFDDEDNPLGPGERGEIVLRGPSVMKGYCNRPEETTAALRNGWLHTGDVGYLDGDGYLYVVDRKKDMIIRGGENIYPAELEGILYGHPLVSEAAVVGVPDPVYGEKVVAYVVVKEEGSLSEAEAIDFIKAHTSPFKAPERVFFTDALPKTGVGKILRRELRGWAKTALG